jgi:O-methyltransferase
MPVKQRIESWRRDRRQNLVMERIQDEHLTYLVPDRLRVLRDCARRVSADAVPGDFIECGVALGGSTILLAESLSEGRLLHAYDVFGMIPAPSGDDPPDVHERYKVIVSGRSEGIGGDEYYGYRDDLQEHVTTTLRRYGHAVGEQVLLYKGLFEDTLHPARPVALAHIDCDWHDPVDTCLRRIGPHVSLGGLIVLDDYNDYGGCRTAADRFMAEHPEFELVRFASNAGLIRR